MDHSEAVQLRASERYLLGELTAEERDQFEEHFFGCMECADDVRAGAALVDNARCAFEDEPAVREIVHAPARRHGWLRWQPAWGFAAAGIVLAGILCYQNLVTIPALKHAVARPQTLASFSLVTAGSRGGNNVVRAPQGRPFGLYVDIPARESFPYYTVDIRTESGKPLIQVEVSAEQAKETVQILVPAHVLPAGSITVVIAGHPGHGGPSTEVARYPFVVEFQ